MPSADLLVADGFGSARGFPDTDLVPGSPGAITVRAAISLGTNRGFSSRWNPDNIFPHLDLFLSNASEARRTIGETGLGAANSVSRAGAELFAAWDEYGGTR